MKLETLELDFSNDALRFGDSFQDAAQKISNKQHLYEFILYKFEAKEEVIT